MGSSALDQLLVAERLAMVQTALESLTDNQRAVFVLVEIERLACPEVARQLGIPVNTVYSRLASGRERFRDAHRRQAEAEQAKTGQPLTRGKTYQMETCS